MAGPGNGTQCSGKLSRVTIGSGSGGTIILNAKGCDITEQGEDIDTTNFEAQGYDTGIIGIQSMTFDVKSDFDLGLNMYNVPGIYPRSDLPNFTAYENVIDGETWSAALCRILSSRNGMPIRGAVSFDFNGKSNGVYINAGGSQQKPTPQ
jgi:hypothetical protein